MIDTLRELLNTEVGGMEVDEFMGRCLLLVGTCIVAFIVSRVLSRLVRGILERAEVPSASIIVNIVRGLIWSVALLGVLKPVFGIEPSGFIAALGITSVALSLGLQDTLSNFIGGLAIMLSKIIVPGDVITVSSFTGVVTDIDWRSTSLRDANGQVNVIPNSVLSKTSLTKLSDFTRTRCQLPIAIAHGYELSDVREDITTVAHELLGERIDEAFGVELMVQGFDAYGVNATVEVHLMPGSRYDVVRTELAERLACRPWVACFEP